MKVGKHEIDTSNRDKVFFPEPGITKGEVIDYYEQVADTMVPHMKNYPVSMHRFPDGVKGGGFYNKNTPDYFPDWINTVKFPRHDNGSFDAPIVDSNAALVYLANQAVLTPHLYLSRTDKLEYPDKMIYDLDPPEGTEDFDALRKAALDIREMLDELGLKSWVQTTGSKGFHIVVPLDRKAKFDKVRDFATDIALVLVKRDNDRYTLEQRKNKRKGRIFLDMLRNSYGATAVAPYSIRAKPEAPVATPLEWQEVEKGASPRDWNIKSILRRLKQKDDPWSNMMRHAQSLESRRDTLDRILEKEEPSKEEKD